MPHESLIRSVQFASYQCIQSYTTIATVLEIFISCRGILASSVVTHHSPLPCPGTARNLLSVSGFIYSDISCKLARVIRAFGVWLLSPSVLVCSCCHNKIPGTGCFISNRNVLCMALVARRSQRKALAGSMAGKDMSFKDDAVQVSYVGERTEGRKDECCVFMWQKNRRAKGSQPASPTALLYHISTSPKTSPLFPPRPCRLMPPRREFHKGNFGEALLGM